jgi:hypothetical protein
MTHCLVNHHISGHLVFVLVSAEWVMMCPVIDNPASWEIRVVIRFLHAKNKSSAEILSELCSIYGQNVMSEGTVRQWCRMFKDGRTNVHDEERNVWPAICSEWQSCSKCWPKILRKTAFHNFRIFTLISAHTTHYKLCELVVQFTLQQRCYASTPPYGFMV